MATPIENNTEGLQEILQMVQQLPESSNVKLQEKTVTPSTTSQTVTPDSGYNGLSKVTVGAMPTATQATPSISVSNSGLITASATQTAGYVSAGTKSSTQQMTIQAAKTITPGDSSQTAVAPGVYTTGAITVAAIPSSYTQLNFTVVGGTSQPSNAAENTIWVNTSTGISKWLFSAAQPSSPSSGMVWISIGSNSNNEFNALKNNGIQIYPLIAKQYVSGKFTYKAAKIYKNRMWTDLWDGILFDDGNQSTSTTGGWEKKSGLSYYDRTNTGTVSAGDTLVADARPASALAAAIISTKNGIDLTGATSVTIVVEYYEKNPFIAAHSFTSGDLKNAQALKEITSSGTYALDVSNLNGEYYISIGGNSGAYIVASRITLQS